MLSLARKVEDPRLHRKRLHSLPDILLLTICAVICGADDWVSIAAFGQEKLPWLRRIGVFANGIPSHDTLGRVFSLLSPDKFGRFFSEWMDSILKLAKGQVISIDGKTLRGSYDTGSNKAAIHMVSAWADKNHVVIGQLKTDSKSNEITTIPKLLELLCLKGCIVTIDAMGCQREIADKVLESGADYILSVKDNQPTLHQEVQTAFKCTPAASTDQTITKDHGRIETRICTVIDDLRFVDEAAKWSGIVSIVKMERIRQMMSKNQSSEQTSYYISSLKTTAEQFNQNIRSHWGIENKLHWTLDVAFAEDQCRIRKGFADQNLSIVRRMALNLLKNETTAKVGIKNKRLKAGWNETYLEKVLRF